MRYSRSFTKRIVRSLVVVFLVGRQQKLTGFWQSQVDHPSYASHPSHRREFPHQEKACPLYVHGDDVASIGLGKICSKTVNVLSFGGLLSQRGAAADSHILRCWCSIASRWFKYCCFKFVWGTMCLCDQSHECTPQHFWKGAPTAITYLYIYIYIVYMSVNRGASGSGLWKTKKDHFRPWCEVR